MPVSIRYPHRVGGYVKPPMLEQIIDLASRLSAPFDFIRIDLDAMSTGLRVGKLTNCPGGAVAEVTPPKLNSFWASFSDDRGGSEVPAGDGLGQSASPASGLDTIGERRQGKRSGGVRVALPDGHLLASAVLSPPGKGTLMVAPPRAHSCEPGGSDDPEPSGAHAPLPRLTLFFWLL